MIDNSKIMEKNKMDFVKRHLSSSHNPDVKTAEDLEIERRMIRQHPDWLKYIRDPSDELRQIAMQAFIEQHIKNMERGDN